MEVFRNKYRETDKISQFCIHFTFVSKRIENETHVEENAKKYADYNSHIAQPPAT
jgi:hypothetical protein